MFSVIFAVLVLIPAAIWLPAQLRKILPSEFPFADKIPTMFRWASSGLAVFMLLSVNYAVISSNHVGLLTARYGSAPANGRIIALEGERGNRAELLLPGFNIIIGGHILYDIHQYPMVEIPTGYYGRLATRDGRANTTDFTTAPEWIDAEFSKMLDATYFMSGAQDGSPRGTKGLQSSILKPGRYALNLYLYEVRVGFSQDEEEIAFVGQHGSGDWVYDINTVEGKKSEQSSFRSFMTRIPSGYVGVVRSSISRSDTDCKPFHAATGDNGLVAELVHRGCRGVWTEVLNPGDYYMNRDIYDIIKVPTRVQTWEFKGGYKRRQVALSVDQDGKITQTESVTDVPRPEGAADQAVQVKVEGWDVPQELRVLVQIEPKNAPIVVAAVGGLKEVEDKVLVPVIRSVVRNVMGGEARYPVVKNGRIVPGEFESRPSRVNDLIENRTAIESVLQGIIQLEGVKTGLDIREVRLGEPALPPEFLVTRLRQQLAEQLQATLQKETIAQNERVKREQAKATADQQALLVKAQIDVQVSEQYKTTRQNNGEAEKVYTISVAQGNREKAILEGEAEKRRLELIADGQKAQAAVLGQESTLKMQMLNQVLTTLAAHPAILEALAKMKIVPDQVVVTGGGNTTPLDMSAFGAVFGALSNPPKK